MFEPLERLIKLNQIQNPRIFLAPQICCLAAEAIKEFVPQVKDKVKVVSYQDSRLKVASSDPMILHQIKMSEEKIIKRVRQKTKIKPFRIIYLPKG